MCDHTANAFVAKILIVLTFFSDYLVAANKMFILNPQIQRDSH